MGTFGVAKRKAQEQAAAGEAEAPLELLHGIVLAPAGMERYQEALECLTAGGSIAKAASVAGVSTQGLYQALGRMPDLAADVRQRRAVLKELANLRALAVLVDRLEKPDGISNRDLTDILRAIKPPSEDLTSNFNLVLDIKV